MKYEYNSIKNTTPLGDRMLNKLGEEGWELVSHLYDSSDLDHYYTFKREKVGIQDPAIDIRNTPNGPNVWKELYDRYKLTEGYKLTKLVDDLNVIDTRDELETKEEINKDI